MNNRVHANAVAYNLRQPWRINNPIPLKLLIAMKLTAILLLAFSLQVTANALAQNITLKVKDEPFERVLRDIRRQSGYAFIYSTRFLENAHPVSVEVENRDVLEALPLIFDGQPFEYEVREKIILIKEKALSTGEKQAQQQLYIKGMVTDSLGKPLVGANIHFSGSTRVIVTDDNGNFILPDERPTSMIIVTNIGYQKKEIPLSLFLSPDPALPDGVRSVRDTDGTINLWISLSPVMGQLDETVVIGYGTTTQRLNTGSVARITARDINYQPINNSLQAMQGRMAGVQVQQRTGTPGGGFSVQIRGRNSLRVNGNDPLYIVDGVPFISAALSASSVSGGIINQPNPLSTIDPNSIESIEVLKDADATSIYGSRGANGVVLITTKKGTNQGTNISLNVLQGIGKVADFMDLLNTEQYLEMRNEAYRNDSETPNGYAARDLLQWDTTRYTDWQRELLGGTAGISNVNLNISGGNNSTQFMIGTGYYRESTVFPGNFRDQRFSGNINLNHKSANNKFLLSFKGNYLVQDNVLPLNDPTRQALTLPPNAPELYMENGELNWEESTWTNPVADLRRNYKGNSYNLNANMVLSYQLLPSLQIKTSIGYNDIAVADKSITPVSSLNPETAQRIGSTIFSDNSNKSWIIEPQIDFRKNIGNHSLNILVGSTLQNSQREGQMILASGYTSDALSENIHAASSLQSYGFTHNQYRYISGFARLNYSWKEKYLVNITARRDGSSRFGPDNRFANFGAIGTAWIFSKENFAENLDFLSFGKLRGSYGITGSDQIGDYQYLDSYSATTAYQGIAGLIPSRLFNPNFAWESNKKLEAALDLGFIKDRVLVSVAYYRNRSSNQLVGYSLPLITGFSSIQANFPAIVQNTGLEFELNSINIQSGYLKWNTGFNLTIPRNKLVAYPGIEGSTYANTYEVGKSLYALKMLPFTGVDPQTGIYTFADLDGDGIGGGYPGDLIAEKEVSQRLFGGLQNNIQFKNWQLDFFLQFVKQNGYNYIQGGFNYPGFFGNQPTDLMARWQNPGDQTDVQMFSQSWGDATNALFSIVSSDFTISDASFIRLRNLAISYGLPNEIVNRIGLKNLRFSLQGQNLITLTNFMGMNPENQNASSLPPLRIFMLGIQANL